MEEPSVPEVEERTSIFNPFMARCVKRLVDGGLTGRVVEFGNQRYGAKGVVAGTEKVTTTSQFYRQLGFTSYLALDVNTDMGAVIVDLNEPILGNVFTIEVNHFSLVTNNGTGEHIFDQAMVFKNAHDLCLTAGVMLHVLPFSPWINHGFYCFNPILFRDLAAANGYRIMFVVIGHRDRGEKELSPDSWPWLFAEKDPVVLHGYMRDQRVTAPSGDLLIGVALQKQTNEPFRKPLQGKYQKDVESGSLVSKYAPQKVKS